MLQFVEQLSGGTALYVDSTGSPVYLSVGDGRVLDDWLGGIPENTPMTVTVAEVPTNTPLQGHGVHPRLLSLDKLISWSLV